MGLTIKAEPQEGYLHVTIEGEYSLSAAVEVLGLVLTACEQHQADKVLLDVRSVTGAISAMDRFQFSEAFSGKYFDEKKAGKISHARFAIIGNYPIIDPNRFGETVAVNRGMTLKVSTDMAEAMDWLLVK